jgi:hypothetical protein
VGWLSLGSLARPGLQLITSAIRTLARDLPLRAHSAPERCLGFVEAIGQPVAESPTVALGGSAGAQRRHAWRYVEQGQLCDNNVMHAMGLSHESHGAPGKAVNKHTLLPHA